MSAMSLNQLLVKASPIFEVEMTGYRSYSGASLCPKRGEYLGGRSRYLRKEHLLFYLGHAKAALKRLL